MAAACPYLTFQWGCKVGLRTWLLTCLHQVASLFLSNNPLGMLRELVYLAAEAFARLPSANFSARRLAISNSLCCEIVSLELLLLLLVVLVLVAPATQAV